MIPGISLTNIVNNINPRTDPWRIPLSTLHQFYCSPRVQIPSVAGYLGMPYYPSYNCISRLCPFYSKTFYLFQKTLKWYGVECLRVIEVDDINGYVVHQGLTPDDQCF